MHPASIDAADLARRLAQADATGRAALVGEVDALFAQHQDLVYAACLRFVPQPERAAELAQETLLKAWQKLPAFRGESRFSTWLIGIARYECLNARRKSAELLVDDGVVDPTDEGVSVLAELRLHERESLLRDASAAVLDPTEQACIELRYVELMDLQTIDEVLELTSKSGARGVLQRCKRKLGTELRRRLEALGHGSSFLRASVSG
ncbi:MAG: sigma-70 family RNA polymerase sigma factor [Alphaproteobacteria bacterium]|nr:sigma-70 family RNA polymerase sigma factor [Alphaproteobacteria bacterium]